MQPRGERMEVIKIKRIYEAAEDSDGFRILVDRLWPRGIKKEKAKIDLWLKEIAPSDSLRKWFHHEPEKWGEFQQRYLGELKEKKDCIETILAEIKKSPVTLLYSAKDQLHNNALVLKVYLSKQK